MDLSKTAAIHHAKPQARATVCLRIVSGPHRGEEFVFDSHHTLVVGRAADAQWRMLNDPFFSRYHFRIEINPPACRLLDLGSTNGVHVNGRREQDVNLKDADRIECGDTVFEVAISAPPAAEEPTQFLSMRRTVQDNFEAPGPPQLPLHFGAYLLDRELGRGSMGAVYHAVHRPTGRELAVKLIQPAVPAETQAVKLFLREASLLSQLRHARIVEYFSHGLQKGRMYVAMEYLPAIDARQLLASQSHHKQVRLACGLVCRVLEALEFAHQQNIVHRDIKPSNVLVYKWNGRLHAKLADFGLAKNFLDAGLTSITSENEIRGTLNYIAPEQIIDCRYAKPACDIYGVGVCLYHFLSGCLPYDLNEGTSAVGLILNNPPRPLIERVSELPAGLLGIVDRALARDPDSRPSAAQMREALEPFTSKGD